MPTPTCTFRSAVAGLCGKPAVYVEGDFAECAEHAAQPGSMAGTAGKPSGGVQVGDRVQVRRYGQTYDATVVEVGSRGAVYAEFTYGNGAVRRVRV